MKRVRGLQSVPTPGTRVRMSGYFLKATGQHTGPDGAARWKVMPCTCELCAGGEMIAVDEPAYDYGQWDDIPKEERPKWRHIALQNLELVGKVPHSRDLADASELVAGKKSEAQLDREIEASLAARKRR